MSSESVGSGAIQNWYPSTTGMIARLPISTQDTGLSMASINPTVTTSAAHADSTKSFR